MFALSLDILLGLLVAALVVTLFAADAIKRASRKRQRRKHWGYV